MSTERTLMAQSTSARLLDSVFNLFRGALIGIAELIPGVSGGTIALIVGIYERVLESGDHIITAVKRLLVGPDRVKGFVEELKKADWLLLIPLLIGMAGVVLTLAGTMETFVTEHSSLARGLFLGMVAASVIVPLLMVDWKTVHGGARWARLIAFFLIAAGAAYLLTSSGAGASIENPSLLVVFAAAAVAICALALPGVSGSFFLLIVGLYAPTMRAVADRDLAYIAAFGLGAITGLSLFIKGLNWLMQNRHTAMMFVMSGLLLGSLRALWPWQNDDGVMLPVGHDAGVVFGLTALGVVVVAILVWVDHFLTSRVAREGVEEAATLQAG